MVYTETVTETATETATEMDTGTATLCWKPGVTRLHETERPRDTQWQ